MEALEAYLRECLQLRGIGNEPSHYPAIRQLIDSAGKALKPPVVFIGNPRHTEQNQPDGALFPSNHLPKPGQAGLPFDDEKARKPERGVVEVKLPGDELDSLIAGDQVRRYLQTYRQVLVTNLRQFAQVQLRDGRAVEVERYSLADSPAAFYELASGPRAAARRHGGPLFEFLNRALRATTELGAPAEVAAFLASYAREARHALDLNDDVLELQALQSAVEDALGVKFEGDKGDDFFRSTLVQTLFYGMFSAWVLWHEEAPRAGEKFDWQKTPYYLKVPVVDRLFVGTVTRRVMEQTGIEKTLKSAEEVLNRVVWSEFHQAFEKGLAVQYFYEPFLAAFDPELRKQLGVWYTPPEIVRYMVARVDQVLREELDEPDGLASPNVLVLDPCCGTGAYLVECLNVIAKRYADRGEALLHGDDIKKAATERLFGFELLPGPFVVAHLQMSYLLAKQSVHLRGDERAAIYLTNALTGWDPAQDEKAKLDPLSLVAESEAAKEVKRDKPILVVLGNPPYNGYAGTFQMKEELDLTNRYDSGRRRGQGLNDLYVRFFAMADRRIEATGRGVISFISNYSWLDGLSFSEMRKRYLSRFQKIWIDNLHGDRRISEYAPDGRTSETVFAVSGQSVGIKVGISVALLTANSSIKSPSETGKIYYRDFHAAKAGDRRLTLVNSLPPACSAPVYIELQPEAGIGYPFKPSVVGMGYLAWARLPNLMPFSFPGVKTSRDDLLVDIDRSRLEQRMRAYFDPKVSDAEIASLSISSMLDSSAFHARAVRTQLQKRGIASDALRPYCYRPFDVRSLYYEPDSALIDRSRADYVPHVHPGNLWLVAQEKPRREWSTAQVVQSLACLDLMDRGANATPMRLHRAIEVQSPQASLLDSEVAMTLRDRALWNLSSLSWDYLESIQLTSFPESIFFHTLAILHSPSYAAENEGALRQDWPRLPLPADCDVLLQGLELGRRLATLLDPETEAPGVTQGDVPPHLQAIARFEWDLTENPEERSTNLNLDANWGYRLPSSAVMPATGRIIKHNASQAQPGLEGQLAGPVVIDVIMNGHARWTGIPEAVWNYTLGGYQVLKKWLSYREHDVLGRPMKLSEVREFQNIARRIAAILAMGPELDAHYEASKAAAQPLDGVQG